MVAEDVGEVGRREVVAREEVGGGREVGDRDGEESDGSEGREVRERARRL